MFSITLAASATLMFVAKNVPASITSSYRDWITAAELEVEPETTFTISLIERFLSPGFIRSGE